MWLEPIKADRLEEDEKCRSIRTVEPTDPGALLAAS
jgi:hypothetical protein